MCVIAYCFLGLCGHGEIKIEMAENDNFSEASNRPGQFAETTAVVEKNSQKQIQLTTNQESPPAIKER